LSRLLALVGLVQKYKSITSMLCNIYSSAAPGRSWS